MTSLAKKPSTINVSAIRIGKNTVSHDEYANRRLQQIILSRLSQTKESLESAIHNVTVRLHSIDTSDILQVQEVNPNSFKGLRLWPSTLSQKQIQEKLGDVLNSDFNMAFACSMAKMLDEVMQSMTTEFAHGKQIDVDSFEIRKRMEYASGRSSTQKSKARSLLRKRKWIAEAIAEKIEKVVLDSLYNGKKPEFKWKMLLNAQGNSVIVNDAVTCQKVIDSKKQCLKRQAWDLLESTNASTNDSSAIDRLHVDSRTLVASTHDSSIPSAIDRLHVDSRTLVASTHDSPIPSVINRLHVDSRTLVASTNDSPFLSKPTFTPFSLLQREKFPGSYFTTSSLVKTHGKLGAKTIEIFLKSLPRNPYVTNNVNNGLLISNKSITKNGRVAGNYRNYSLLQVNRHQYVRWITLDFDYSIIEYHNRNKCWPWENVGINRVGILSPTLMTINPANGHAHVHFGIRNPVSMRSLDSIFAQTFLASINYSLVDALGSDVCYIGLMAKNPIHKDWVTVVVNPIESVEDLPDLTDYANSLKSAGFVVRPPIHHRSQMTPDWLALLELSNVGRNVSIFHTARLDVYDQVSKNRNIGRESLSMLVESVVQAHNRAMVHRCNCRPLSDRELGYIAKSIASWVFKKRDIVRPANKSKTLYTGITRSIACSTVDKLSDVDKKERNAVFARIASENAASYRSASFALGALSLVESWIENDYFVQDFRGNIHTTETKVGIVTGSIKARSLGVQVSKLVLLSWKEQLQHLYAGFSHKTIVRQLLQHTEYRNTAHVLKNIHWLMKNNILDIVWYCALRTKFPDIAKTMENNISVAVNDTVRTVVEGSTVHGNFIREDRAYALTLILSAFDTENNLIATLKNGQTEMDVCIANTRKRRSRKVWLDSRSGNASPTPWRIDADGNNYRRTATHMLRTTQQAETMLDEAWKNVQQGKVDEINPLVSVLIPEAPTQVALRKLKYIVGQLHQNMKL